MPFSIGYSSSRRPTYGLNWADSVIKDTSRKHPRGLSFFEQFTGLSRDMLAFILARNKGEWHTCRKCIKNLERMYDLREHFRHDLEWLAINLLASVQVFEKNAQESHIETFASWAEGLTARKFRVILEEPIEKGGMVRSDSDELSLPSLFRREACLEFMERCEKETERRRAARDAAHRAGL